MSAFAVRHLSVLTYASGAGFTLWHYKAAAVADVERPGFFDDAADMIAPGDHMHVSAPDGGALILLRTTGLSVFVEPMFATCKGAAA